MARNILVVEDDRNISDLIRMYLEKEGFEVRSAYDGGKAVEEYDKQAPDMVLLDIMLPDGSGLQLLEELKRQRRQAGIIIISARDSLDDKIEGLELGADDYLPKPFHLAELSARIRSVVRRHQRGGQESLDAGNVRLFPDSRLQNFYINIERKGIKEYAKSNKKSGKEKVSQI